MTVTQRLAALILALVLLAPAAEAFETYKPGHVADGLLAIGGKQVPLPAGSWTVAAHRGATMAPGLIDFGPYGVIHDLILFRIEAGEIDAFVQVNANELPVADGWGVSKDCRREDLLGTAVRYQSGWDASCQFVTHVRTDVEGASSPSWSDALAYARTRNLSVPAEWVIAGFRASNRRDVVDVRFAFSPQQHGFPPSAAAWAESPWHKDRFETDRERAKFVQEIAEWLAPFANLVEDGLKNRLAKDASFPMPSFTDVPTPEQKQVALAGRLRQLDLLHENRLISDEAHRAQRALLISGKADEPTPQPDAETIALWKTISYRPMVSTANLFIDYYWVGSPFATGVLVLLQIVVNTTKFYFHEVAWERFFGGSAGKRDAPRVVDFTYAGYAG